MDFIRSTDTTIPLPPPILLPSGCEFIDMVLGGGHEEDTSTLLAGPYGTGKTTLAMQWLGGMCRTYKKVGIYLSAEQKLAQLRNLAKRLRVESDWLFIAATQSVLEARKLCEREKASFAVFDSLQEFGGLVTRDYTFPPTRMILSQMNALGSVTGKTANEHGTDAVLFVNEQDLPEDWEEKNPEDESILIVPMQMRSIKNRNARTGHRFTYRLTNEGAVPYQIPDKYKKSEPAPAPALTISATEEPPTKPGKKGKRT